MLSAELLLQVLALVGFLALVAVRLIERTVGEPSASMVIALGLLAELVVFLGLPFGVYSQTGWAPWFALGLILWSIVTAIRYSLFFARASPPPFVPVVTHCRSRLINGVAERHPLAPQRYEQRGGNLPFHRTFLRGLYDTYPTAEALDESFWAAGGAWYGIYATCGSITMIPSRRPPFIIWCTPLGNKKCEAEYSERGSMRDRDGPVQGVITNAATASGDTVVNRVWMSASLSASGGPSISPFTGFGWITVSWPDASWIIDANMGTYKWRCYPLDK
jgi:hypothetical protein